MRRADAGNGKETFAGLYAVDLRHLPIYEGDFVRLAGLGRLTNHLDAFLARRSFISDERHILEQARYYGAGRRIVVNDEHATSQEVRP